MRACLGCSVEIYSCHALYDIWQFNMSITGARLVFCGPWWTHAFAVLLFCNHELRTGEDCAEITEIKSGLHHSTEVVSFITRQTAPEE